LKRAEEMNLTLRKNKLNDIFSKKRGLNTDDRFIIKEEMLQIPDFIKVNYECSIDKIDILAKLLLDSDINIKKFAILKLRLISQKPKLDDYEINSILQKIHRTLIAILADPSIDKKTFFEVSWALINFLSDEPVIFFPDFRNENLFKSFNLILSNMSTEYPIVKHIFWIIGNIITEGDIFEYISDYMNLETHYYNWTLNLEWVDSEYEGNILWSFYNYLAAYLEYEKNEIGDLFPAVFNCLNILKKSINIQNETCLCESLSYFKDVVQLECFNETLVNNGIVPIIIVCFESVKQLKFINYCVRILSTLLSCKDQVVEEILKYPVMQKLLETLEGCVESMKAGNKDPLLADIVRNVYLAFSNITACQNAPFEQIMTNEKLRGFTNYLYYDKMDYNIIYEIVFMIYNIFINGNLYVKAEFVKYNFANFIYYPFQMKDVNCPDKLYIILLDCLYEMLKYGESTSNKINVIQREIETMEIHDVIDKLCYHKAENIYNRALKLMKKFWGGDEFYYDDKSSLEY
jgi:hypothetical protein